MRPRSYSTNNDAGTVSSLGWSAPNNSSSLGGVPWELIIKVYRGRLGKGTFPTLQGYWDNFLTFLNDPAHGLLPAALRDTNGKRAIGLAAVQVVKEVVSAVPSLANPSTAAATLALDWTQGLASLLTDHLDTKPTFNGLNPADQAPLLAAHVAALTTSVEDYLEEEWPHLKPHIDSDIKTPERTASALDLFEQLGMRGVAFFDEGGQIQSEWGVIANFAPEWFAEWLADGFSGGRLYEVEASSDAQLAKRYRALGFPNSKDIWYIKTAHGLRRLCNRSRPLLVAEDIDFYDPKQKNSTNKRAIFIGGKGPVSKQLDSDGIDLKCIENAIGALKA